MASTTLILILFLLFIQMLICASSQQPEKHNNITLGSVLTTKPQNSKWVSNNKDFAFGFYSISPTLYILGVWFDSISNKTLVWTAMEGKRDISVGQGSTLKLTNSGLQLLDSRGNFKWSNAPLDNKKVSAGAMLDNGNFVLVDDAFLPIWQSFLSPTDTLLPGQTLSWRSTMYSKFSSTNFSSGRFELAMQDDGNLVLYPVDRDRDAGGAYWMSDTGTPGDNQFDLHFNASGFIYLVGNSYNKTIYPDTDAGYAPRGRGNFLRRLTLDSDGILRNYVWNKASWSSIWSSVKDPCKDVKGQCGRNGICQLTEHGNPNCTCPPGFDFVDSEDHFQGCLQNSSHNCTSRTTMSELDNTDWPNGQHYSELPDVSEDDCKQSCMDDCMCIIVTYLKPVCWKKQTPLMDGRQGTDIKNKAFVKVQFEDEVNSSFFSSPPRTSPLFLSAPIPVRLPKPNETKGVKGKSLALLGISLLGCSTTLVAASFLFIWLCGYGRKTRSTTDKIEGLRTFNYKDIQAATGGFTQELGRGAFGKVYKGTLPDGREIAAKMLDKLSEEDHTEKEFTTEMSVIGTSQHKNLLRLYGFCNDDSHKLLICEYMSNGSLDRALFVGNGFLDWNTRLQIAVATARGLLYLHEECRTQILHCDIKPQNILLDDNFNPKISDFGLAKLMNAEQTRTFTEARGTKGYIAPEWYKNMPITAKVDVYSFGVMLLEIICCRKTMVLDAPEKEIFLSYWAYGCLNDGTLMKLVEKQVLEGNPIEAWQLERMVLVALWCIQEDPNLRPTMKKVVQMLEGTMEIAVPPSPI